MPMYSFHFARTFSLTKIKLLLFTGLVAHAVGRTSTWVPGSLSHLPLLSLRLLSTIATKEAKERESGVEVTVT